MSRSFVKEFFDNKSLEGLKKTITGDWSEKNVNYHLGLLKPPPKAQIILEIGCGLGRLLIPLYDRGAGHLVGVDASRSMIDTGQEFIKGRNIQMLYCDGSGVLELPLDGYFDWAFSVITFQHIPNTETVKRYLGEAYRLLKHRGGLTFQVLSHDVKPGRELWTYHNRAVLQDHLDNLGFKGQWEEAGVWAIYRGRKWRKTQAI
jgi:SAM-dependent methyltransferase